MRPRLVWTAVALAAAAAAPRLAAQTDPRLQAAVALAQAGRVDSARALVDRLLATLPAQDTVYPQALYTQGILAPDAAAVARALQRVVVEYSWSPWAANALLRLAQLAYAQGDPATAADNVQRLRRDYPDSPVKAAADFWGAKAYFDLKDDPGGCALITEGLAVVGGDLELKNQLAFYAARCGGAPAAPPAAAAPADTARPAAPAPGTPAAPQWAVQVLAVKNAGQVDAVLTRLKALGWAARVDRDTTGLFKVRVGPYTTRAEAERARARLRAQIGGAPFVVEAP